MIFIITGLYQNILRFIDRKVLFIIFIGCLLSSVIMTLFTILFNINISKSIFFVYFLSSFTIISISRFILSSFLLEYPFFKTKRIPVIIYGAGEAGRQLLISLKQTDCYFPVAFIDDNIKLEKTIVYGKKVYGFSKLNDLINSYNVKSILLAIPSATQKQRRIILDKLKGLECHVYSIPGLKDLVENKISINTLKKVSIGELLGREPVDPIASLLQQDITNKIVMVTGAGGSIGSELCRQIVNNKPNALILFELSEFSLYTIERELSNFIAQNNLDIKLIPMLGSVQNQARLEQIMRRYHVDTIYHAAAYKHVPMVEYNTIEGVKNNIFGTLHCALAAINTGVSTFVLISTDKAVRPTNTMGTTKRMAELVLQALAEKQSTTRFCMVRFGNVLGSSGSVIPLFEKQIAAGGPVTITHPEITRFFMTIPEAATLVIQAGAMGKGGDVFLLDMGQPVKIMDLARQMIKLSGLEVRDENSLEGDIEIKVTGLRPGEKLYEELLIGKNAQGTQHPKIMTTIEKHLLWDELNVILTELEQACDAFDPMQVRKVLEQAPTDFHPADPVCDLLI
ncbi:polysaccharide biosynthesis protein [Actinobacillus delphinicola]|nr:nucleoside-diphosphate sugar epimerase/dehydratase [Actinobacillus delphinicola]